MKLNLNGKDYSFKFFHTNKTDAQSKLSKTSPEAPIRATTCMVFDEQGECVSKGTANVHPKDNFCKEKGRKISLRRSMKTWEKSFRSEVWESYRTWGVKNRW